MFKFKWFKDCKSIEDVKKTYRKLAMKYHPDLTGGTTEKEMKVIKEFRKNHLKNLKKDKKNEKIVQKD